VPRLLRHSLLLALLFTLLSQALIAVLVSPLAYWVLDSLIGLSGNAVVANFGLVSFARSPAGIVVIVVGLLGLVLFGLIQNAGLSTINIRALTHQQTSLYGLYRVLLAQSRPLFRTALALAALALGVALPLAALAGLTYWLLLSGADINFFLATKPPQFVAALAIAGVLGAIGLIAFLFAQVRLIFTAALVMFEGKSGFEALRASNAMVRGHSWRIARALLRWIGVILACAVLASLIFSAVFALLAPGPGAGPATSAVALGVLFVASLALGAFQLILTPFLYGGLAAFLYLDQRARLGQEEPPELLHSLNPNAHHVSNRRLQLALVGATALFVLALAALVGVGAQGLAMRPTIAIIAHRAGAAGVPENSLTALRRAIEQGIATYAEIDVQETADGVVVVVHDSDLRRLAGVDARVWDLTLAQVEQADIGKNVGPQFVGERIPTFDEFLDAAKGKIKLNIELKYDRDAPLLAGKVVDQVRAKGMQNEVVISSLNAEGLAQVRTLAPELKIGFIDQLEVGSIGRLDVDFLEPEASQVTSSLMDTADARKLPVFAWTIDDATSAQKMYDAGVTAVITNDPPLVQKALAEREALSDQELMLVRFRKLLGL
jgi:glycerophosphoryl diester phosphodiesterase